MSLIYPSGPQAKASQNNYYYDNQWRYICQPRPCQTSMWGMPKTSRKNTPSQVLDISKSLIKTKFVSKTINVNVSAYTFIWVLFLYIFKLVIDIIYILFINANELSVLVISSPGLRSRMFYVLRKEIKHLSNYRTVGL
jgi:hypothetical protein